MKIKEIDQGMITAMKIRNPSGNHENHENLRNPCENKENHKNIRNQC